MSEQPSQRPWPTPGPPQSPVHPHTVTSDSVTSRLPTSHPSNQNLVPHEQPGIVATPAVRQPATWLAVAAVVMATVASWGLAAVARPAPLYPDVPAAQYVAPSGHRTVLRDEGGSSVVETSHLPGSQGWVERSEAGWGAIGGLEFEDLQTWHWVTETEMAEDSTTQTFYHLGEQGLRVFSGGTTTFEFSAIPAVIELPPDPTPGTTWQQESTLHLMGSARTLKLVRSASIAASPLGEDCITVTYQDTIDEEPSQSAITRCPGRGIVAWDGASLTTEPLTWAEKALTTASASVDFSALTPMQSAIKNGTLDLTPSLGSAPVPLGTGFAYIHQVSNQLGFLKPHTADGADLGLQLGWVRRPGPTTLALLGAGDLVVAATSDRQLVAYDVDGLMRWQVPTADIAGLPPVQLDDDTLVMLTLDGFLTAHDLRTGAQRWRVAAPAGEVPLSIIEVDGRPMTVLVAGPDVHLYDGPALYLSFTMLDQVTSVVRTPSGLVVADTGGLVSLVDLDGRAHWSTWTDECTQLTAIGDTVFCPQETDLLAFSAATGAPLFTRALHAQTLSSDGSLLAVLTADGITVLDPSGDVRSVLPMAQRQAYSSWLVRGRDNLCVITNLSEFFRWGRP